MKNDKIRTNEQGVLKEHSHGVAFNIFVILVIIAAIVGIAARSWIYKDNSENKGKKSGYIITFEIRDGYDSVIRSLKAGDAVYIRENGEIAGYMTSYDGVGGEAYEFLDVNDDTDTGTVPEFPITVSAVAKLKAVDGKSVNGSYLLHGRMYITPGDIIEMYTEKASFKAYITAVDTDES